MFFGIWRGLFKTSQLSPPHGLRRPHWAPTARGISDRTCCSAFSSGALALFLLAASACADQRLGALQVGWNIQHLTIVFHPCYYTYLYILDTHVLKMLKFPKKNPLNLCDVSLRPPPTALWLSESRPTKSERPPATGTFTPERKQRDQSDQYVLCRIILYMIPYLF